MMRSTSSVRLDSGQHEELVMDLDPELVKQHVAMRQSENDFQSSYDFSLDSSASSPRLLFPPNSAGNGSFRRSRDRSPSPSPYTRHKSVPSMSVSPSTTPRVIRRTNIDECDLQSLDSLCSSGTTNNSSPTNSTCDTVISIARGRPEKPSKKESSSMTTQIFPYANEAFEIAAERLGNGMNLRKVSVVKQTPSGPERKDSQSIFGFKKKPKREDSQTAFVFSFSRDSVDSNNKSKNEILADNQEFLRQNSTSTLNELVAPKISVSHVDFTIDEEEDSFQGRALQRYDSDATLTSELARQNDVQNVPKKPSFSEMNRSTFLEAFGDTQDNMREVRKVSSSSVRKRSGLEQVQQSLPLALSSQMLSPRPMASDNISVRSFRSQGSGGRQSSGDPLDGPKSEKDRGSENMQRFWDYWTMVSSIIYAIAILVSAVIFYSLDLFVFKEGTEKSLDLSEYFNILLILGGAVWLVWLMIDINRYTQMIKKYCKEDSGQLTNFKLEEVDGELLISIPITTAPKKLPQYYCFSKGRHSGSFFLKAGATFFCLGHIIHILLNLAKQFIFLKEQDVGNVPCGNWPRIFFQILQPMYVLLQLYMMFKYSNVIVNRSKGTARFAFMHCIATSLVFWVYTLIQETIDYIVKKDFGLDDSDCVDNSSTYRDLFDDFKGEFIQCKTKCPPFSENDTIFDFNIDCVVSQLCNCNKNNEVGKLIFEYGDYLYPFSIEFSILIVGVWYMMWSNIGKVEKYKDEMDFFPSSRRSIDSSIGNPTYEALYIYADCHSSIKGIFLGMCHVTLCITGTIVYIIFLSSGSQYCQSFRVTNDVIECLLLISTIAASIWVYYKIAHLDVNPHPISFLDDLLLFICIPAFFLYAYFSSIPAIAFGDQPGNIITNVLMIVQVLIQTPMIVDGLRRCCDRHENQRLKPGRNLVTFLLIANLSLYFWDTMEAKSDGYGITQKKFYGVYLWTIAKHTTLPLCIFYRFHSSVALADIWDSAYRPGDHH